jgi:hypothetical protein
MGDPASDQYRFPCRKPFAATFEKSVYFDSNPELLVLITDRLDGLFVGEQALINPYCQWFSKRLRVCDAHVDLELSKDRPAKALDERCLITVGSAADIQPPVVRAGFGTTQIVGFDD